MSKVPLFTISFLLIFSFPVLVKAEQPQLRGFLRLDKRVNVGGDSVTIANMYNDLRLEMSARLGKKLFTLSSVDFRFYDFPRLKNLREMEDREKEYPTELSLWEAYIDLYGFLFKDLDLRLGKQRIAWGTADRLNPTDNLNPDDFSDPLNFGEKLPTMAVKATYYLGEYTLTGVWLPSMEPILMPREALTFFGESASENIGGAEINIATLRDSLILPARKPANGMFALKLSGNVFNWDFSLSYFKGYDDLPILKKMVLSPVGQGELPGAYNAFLSMGFPKMQVVGIDFAGEFLSVGLWGEGALFLPEKVTMRMEIDAEGTQESIILSKDPYFKFTLGFDYTFKNGVYFNAQYMHGFFTERGRDNLQDYLMARAEKKFKNDEVKLALGGALEVKDIGDIESNYGNGVFPEVTYYPTDNVELSLGGFLLGGKEGTLFGSWRDMDQVFLKVKVSF